MKNRGTLSAGAWLATLFVTALPLLWPTGASAGSMPTLIISAPTISAPAGSSGSFDVLLSNPTNSPADVGAFAVDLSVLAGSGVTLKSASIATTTPYIFSQPSGFSVSGLPGNELVATDAAFNAPYFQTVNPGDSFGLVQVDYQVARDATGTVDLTIVASSTSVSDPNMNLIAATPIDGQITITAPITTSATPLPATATAGLALLASLAAGSLLARNRRQRTDTARD